MVKGLVKGEGYAYATGYLESFLTEIIDNNVKDQTEKSMLKIRMLDIGINQLLDSKKEA
jgi:hypothetical protein